TIRRGSPHPCRSCTWSSFPRGGWSGTSPRRWPSRAACSARAAPDRGPRSPSFPGRAGRETSNSASCTGSTVPILSTSCSSTGTKGGRPVPKGRQRLAADVRRSIEEPERIGKLCEAMERGRANRAATIEQAGLDLPAFRDRVRSIKETAAQDPSIAEAFADAVRANGGRVLFAATGQEAVRYLLDVCRAQGADFLVKSKCLTSEEIEMNQGLAAEGMRAIETDLGELLCQVAGEKPSHLVFPAIHMTSDRIAKMLTEEYGEPIASEPSSILSAVRAKLRPLFLAAKVGVTGANIGVAQTGSIVVETNEGNGRLVARVPHVHVDPIGRDTTLPHTRPRLRAHLSRSDRHPLDRERPWPRRGQLRPPLRLLRPLSRDLSRRHRHPLHDCQGEGARRRGAWPADRGAVLHGLGGLREGGLSHGPAGERTLPEGSGADPDGMDVGGRSPEDAAAVRPAHPAVPGQGPWDEGWSRR